MVYVPLSYAEMAPKRNGRVELSEVAYASSFGKRPIIKDGISCLEFYAEKDML